MTPELAAYVEAWLNKADHDLIAAQRVLEIEPMILDIGCFHCQQAAEKCLKAFLAWHNCDIEKTHNIIFLLSQCAAIDAIFATIDAMDINAYAVQGRYPDDSLVPTYEEAKAYYQFAIKVRELVVEKTIMSK